MRASLTIFFLAGLFAGLLTLAACGANGDDSGSSSGGLDPANVKGGTANPWRVDTLEELQSIALGFQNETLTEPLSREDSLAAHYVLAADIDASPTVAWNDGDGFVPIGEFEERFTGSFDGAGFVIRGLHIDRRYTDHMGLFGYLENGTLRNVALEGGAVAGYFHVGGLVGNNYYGTVEDSSTTGTVLGESYVGGLVGWNTGTVQDSFASGSVSSDGDRSNNVGWVGGLVGVNYRGTVQGSHASGKVSNRSIRTGGLVGTNSYGTVQDSYASGDVSGTVDVGGLVGENYYGTVHGSYASGIVSGSFDVGGLVGENYYGTVRGSYASGIVSGSFNVGGLVGNSFQGTVQNSFATGDVSGGDSSGGLIGGNLSMVQNSYATGDVSGSFDVGGLVGENGGVSPGENAKGTVQSGYASGSVNGERRSGGLVGHDFQGSVQHAYCVDGTILDVSKNDDGVADCVGDGTGEALSLVTLDALRALTCETAVFDACEAWDFGTSEEPPVLSGTVGGLDPAGQRALIAASDAADPGNDGTGDDAESR